METGLIPLPREAGAVAPWERCSGRQMPAATP